MTNIKKYLKIIIGCVLISIGLNVFIIPSKLVSSETLGIINLLSYNYGFNKSVFLLIINVWTLWLIYMLYGNEKLKEYLIPSLLLPLSIYLTSFINIDITQNVEELLIAISGAYIMGYGYGLLYKEGYKTGAIFILEDMFNELYGKNSKMISNIVDIILIVITLKCFNIEQTLYSALVIIITRHMTTKAKLGISDSKAFYIITSKEKEIKKYLMEDLHYDLTAFEAVGGFTKKKSKVIMTVINTKDYFKVKEGIKIIDPKAFISVTDNYEVRNKNVKINEN